MPHTREDAPNGCAMPQDISCRVPGMTRWRVAQLPTNKHLSKEAPSSRAGMGIAHGGDASVRRRRDSLRVIN